MLSHIYHSLQPRKPRRRRKIRIILTREDIFHTEIPSLAFKKRKADPSRPSNNTLITACSQRETATTSNSCSFWTCVQNNTLQFPSKNLIKGNLLFVSLGLPVALHSLIVPNCNALLFLKNTFCWQNNWLFYFWGRHTLHT